MEQPLALEGWLEFNRRKWDVEPMPVKLAGSGGELPSVEAAFFVNGRGQICQPPKVPYLAMLFQSTSTQSQYRRSRQWLEVSEALLAEIDSRGIDGAILLPPEIDDVRPWQWAGYQLGVRYTYYIDFPFAIAEVDGVVRNRIKKAERLGYRVARTCRMQEAAVCLEETGERKRLSGQFTVADLELARTLMGNEHFRVYVCYAPNGEPAAAQVVLHQPGGRSMAWLMGTVTEHLQTGVTQLLIRDLLEDLQAGGAIGYDFVGANVRSVAAAKANWGGQLTSYYMIEQVGLRLVLKTMRDWWKRAAASDRR